LGYAGWGPGQLDNEIEAGAWIPVDVEPEIVFQTPLSVRYEQALACLGLTPATVWMQAVDE
jgi:putative transcriptional regulator